MKTKLFYIVPTALVMSAYAEDYINEPQAQKLIFPSSTEFIKKTIQLSDDQVDKIKSLAGVKQRNKKPQIWEVKEKTKTLGWFYIDEVVGKHEFISFAIGLDVNGKVLGVEIMSYRETKGGEIRNETWRKFFKGKTLSDPFKLDNDIPNITGATLSSRNLLDGVKRLLVLQQVHIEEKIL